MYIRDMMKRAVAWLLLVALLVSMAACGSAQGPTDPTAGSSESVPADTEPSVTDPSVTDPSVTEPLPTTPAPTDPTTTIPGPTKPGPTQTVPTEPVVTQPKPTDPKPTDPVVTQPKPTDPAPTDPNAGLIDIDSDPLPCSKRALYDQLFDPDRKVLVDIQISDGELQKMQEDYDRYSSFGSKSPIYRMADVVITIDGVGYLIREVGVRMKGNTSRVDFYSAADGIYNAIHLKLDFQQTFDDEAYYGSDAKVWANKDLRKARKDRTFATLEELELRWNKTNDNTYLREIYAHELYASEGVLTPLINLCSLDLGGVHMGLYTVNEPVDKLFLEKRLPAADLGGDLYKCSRKSSFTTDTSIGVEDEDKGLFYAYDLKTNKKTSDHSALKGLIQALKDPAMTREKFASLVDVDRFVTYAAVSWFVGGTDDLRNNYNNFYLYFLKSSGKAIIIPYDMDMCLGLVSAETMSHADPFSDRAEIHKDPDKPQENPLFLHTVVRDSLFVSEYTDALEQVSKNELLKLSTFRSWFQRAKDHYHSHVTPSKKMKNMTGRKMQFDIEYTFTETSANIRTYLSAIMETYDSYME